MNNENNNMMMNKKNLAKKTLLQLIELADFTLHDCELQEICIDSAKPVLQEISRRLEISVDESMWFCAILNLPSVERFDLDDMNRYFDCRPIKGLQYQYLFDSLKDRDWISGPFDNGNYSLNPWVFEAIRLNTKPVLPPTKNLKNDEWLCAIADTLNNDHLSIEQRAKHIRKLMDDNSKLPIVKNLQIYKLDDIDMQVMLVTVCAYALDNDEQMGRFDIDDLFSDKRQLRMYMRRLRHNDSSLLPDVIEFLNINGQVDNSQWKLTDKAKEAIFIGTSIEVKKNTETYNSQLLEADKITPKQLFFCDNVRKQVDDLKEMLSDKRFGDIQKRLESRGMRRGFTCLFYGTPGTGKTETTLQLARETGRNIIQVDMSSMRSKWVGESEKIVKDVFVRYRNICEKSEKTPILLFNEADAIFNKRNEGATSSVDKMENTMQNIILQEMENFDGILIATTNLTNNLDSAFERRFLYKVEFVNPTPKERMHIWTAMIPELAENDALMLATDYEFSGGQIENIARKQVVNSILYDNVDLVLSIREACRNEKLSKKSLRKAIGFC